MNFKTLLFLSIGLFFFSACGDSDEEPMTTQIDLLVANNWVYEDIYVSSSPIGLTSCLGDDFLSFTASGTVNFNVGMESDTCTFNALAYSGTYEVRNDSLFITATDTDGGDSSSATEITLLNSTELRLQGEDSFLGISEARYTAL